MRTWLSVVYFMAPAHVWQWFLITCHLTQTCQCRWNGCLQIMIAALGLVRTVQ